jgi:hypothetical protein
MLTEDIKETRGPESTMGMQTWKGQKLFLASCGISKNLKSRDFSFEPLTYSTSQINYGFFL